MDFSRVSFNHRGNIETILGYLNYSSGERTPAFLKALNEVCGELLTERGKETTPLWKVLGDFLELALSEKSQEAGIFSNDTQARKTLQLVSEHFIPFYRKWHEILLSRQPDDTLWNAFSLGQLFETILTLRAFETDLEDELETDATLQKVVVQYDDYIGYRPIPVLRTKQKMQPYPHEWVHAIPLYFRGVGVLRGPYEEMVSKTIEILENLPEDFQQEALFDFDLLEELSFDPRPLDFDHPVNRRLNYHFGGWDWTLISNSGYFRRFVLIESTLDSIFSRIQAEWEAHRLPKKELSMEASAVLAGTLLMGAAVCGWGPGAHDSSVTFTTLLPKVAQLRDRFYAYLLCQVSELHAKRLQKEKFDLHQPFAGARQYFNHHLSHRRAEQFQNAQLARLYAWMGYPDAMNERLQDVLAPSTQIRCRMDCLLTQAHLCIDHEHFSDAIPMLYEIERQMYAGIECGALLDPWYILGFEGQYPLSSSVEDTTQDNRVEELTTLVNSVLGLYSRLLKITAAEGMYPERKMLSLRMKHFAQWWDQFGTLDIATDIRSVSGQETYESTLSVVEALDAWHQGGTATGDIAFWRPRVVEFSSAKAYTLLIEALQDQHDQVASMALLTYWLSMSELVPLDDGEYSFHPLALRWMEDLWYPPTKEQRLLCRRGNALQDGWDLARRFVDSVEANAEIYGVVPELEMDEKSRKNKTNRSDDFLRSDSDQEDGPEDILDAAWEDVTYRDTTDDGNDANTEDPDALRSALRDFPLTDETDRISDRLIFFVTQARLWKMAAIFSIPFAEVHPDRSETLQMWQAQAVRIRKQLDTLIEQISAFSIDEPEILRPNAMMEYERKISLKYTLLERAITTSNELFDAIQLMRIADTQHRIELDDTWESATAAVIQSLICKDPENIKKIWNRTVNLLEQEPILFVPVERGGDPHQLLRIRNLLMALQRMLVNLPKLGRVAETYRVLKTVQVMEHKFSASSRSVTRYDYLFELANKSIGMSLLQSATRQEPRWDEADLLQCLGRMMDILGKNWVEHSRGIRVSAMDSFLHDERGWEELKDFIQEYGNDLLNPVYLNYGNLQAIHHQGVRHWLQALVDDFEPEMGASLAESLRSERCSMDKAVFFCDVIFDTLLEHYGQFIDYNTTTTLSDHGENMYMLFDFLRLLATYDRKAWEMRPLVTTHSVIVRESIYDIADEWTAKVEDSSQRKANYLLRRYEELCKRYGMTLKSVADRLSERFIRSMSISKLCALLEPAVLESRMNGQGGEAFGRFQELIAEFTKEVVGTGFEPPTWMEELNEEVQHYRTRSEDDDEMLDLGDFISGQPLTVQDFEAIIKELELDEVSHPWGGRRSKHGFPFDLGRAIGKMQVDGLVNEKQEDALIEELGKILSNADWGEMEDEDSEQNENSEQNEDSNTPESNKQFPKKLNKKKDKKTNKQEPENPNE